MTDNTQTFENLLTFAAESFEEYAPAFLTGLQSGLLLMHDHPRDATRILTGDYGAHFCGGSASFDVVYRALLASIDLDRISIANRSERVQ